MKLTSITATMVFLVALAVATPGQDKTLPVSTKTTEALARHLKRIEAMEKAQQQMLTDLRKVCGEIQIKEEQSP